MASVFWDTHGILFIKYLEKGKTINRDYYMGLLDRLRAEIEKKRPYMQTKQVLFHQIEWIKLRIASSPTMFTRSCPQRLLALCWPEKMLQEMISFDKKGIEIQEKR